MANTALLCLGSNMADVASGKIDEALSSISLRIGPVKASSGKYNTPCYHQGQVTDEAGYLNEVVISHTSLDASAIESICKEIEAALGRNALTRQMRMVPIDIDLVALNQDIIRPLDFNSPYFKKGYQKILEK